jgi:hypothetical protein
MTPHVTWLPPELGSIIKREETTASRYQFGTLKPGPGQPRKYLPRACCTEAFLNRQRFPGDFLFQLTREERDALTSQFAMSEPDRGGCRVFSFLNNAEEKAEVVTDCDRLLRPSVSPRVRFHPRSGRSRRFKVPFWHLKAGARPAPQVPAPRHLRNAFPFLLRLTAKETEGLNRSQTVTGSLRSQIVTSNSGSGRGGRRYVPYAFTEYGAIVASEPRIISPEALI